LMLLIALKINDKVLISFYWIDSIIMKYDVSSNI